MKSIFLKNSKKLLLTLALLLLSTPFFAQSAFDKFEGQDDITALIVNRKMFELMSKVKVDATDKEAQRYMNLIKKLDNLRVFSTASSKATTDLKLTADKYVKSVGLEELMRVNDSGKNIKILVKSGSSDSQIKELLMFIEGSGKTNQTVLMSLTGDFDLNEISILTDKMKIPGGEELKKASKNNR
ncbi:DUF4252 domain-containing protein [Flavobacterium sp. F-380]|uniref:DUF4252 domain-containing protein n=1 Tax=Flavobacterium kayseriense TaxID=2764714 RepID=A0ABR7J2S2_9FLAO|nr:DUF4252 domain-containing protein [Flavobacterium kayseriense]MBC5839821.1 DUF4252 domain-containing protein [Flavobacterium kayseriense]MBC5847509.1 DUF4252 domain-containing protein [Flavobacterium kayseriense]